MTTPAMELYLEQVYILIETKGRARAADIAARLTVAPSSVTRSEISQ